MWSIILSLLLFSWTRWNPSFCSIEKYLQIRSDSGLFWFMWMDMDTWERMFGTPPASISRTRDKVWFQIYCLHLLVCNCNKQSMQNKCIQPSHSIFTLLWFVRTSSMSHYPTEWNEIRFQSNNTYTFIKYNFIDNSMIYFLRSSGKCLSDNLVVDFQQKSWWRLIKMFVFGFRKVFGVNC